MATKNHPIAWFLMFLSLFACAVQASAQRGGRGGGARGGGGHHAQAGSRGGGHRAQSGGRSQHQASRSQARGRTQSANRGRQHSAGRQANSRNRSNAARHNANRNASANRNANRNVNRNTNRNVNRNVNANRNVSWNGNYWGGARIAAGRYYWPRGYGYVRRTVGWVMPAAFLTSAYYYNGWATLGLTGPMAGYQWVRYGPDLLLVEIATGQVVDVRYGVFDY
jgi:Ni/Co efflux regulator RcnB